MPVLSLRGQQLPASPIRKLAPLAQEAEAKGIKILSLNIGQPDLPSPPEALKALHSIDRDVLEYSASDGIASLKSKLSEYYNRFEINVSANDIIVTSGGSEAVLLAFLSCLNPGDEVIIPEPAYANYISFAMTAGAVIRPVLAKIENGFALPPVEEFEKLITPRTKAILICNPNNPTGYVYTKEELLKLNEIVKRNDLFLFSDEVYREFCYTDEPYFSALQLPGAEENVVLIDSVSKRYNECGIRIGCIVTRNEKLRENVMKFCQARLSPPLVGQIVAEASIDTSKEYLEHTYNEYVDRRNFLVNGLNDIPGVFSPMPMGAFYTVVKLPVEDAEEFCKWCLKEYSYKGKTIFMAPAAGFYSTPNAGRNEVRVAYVLKKEDLADALEVLRHALAAYHASGHR
ncbi:MAG: pyridoxal phosphate-dependent aminotransferase [Bacteroidales bacterium]|nr:pyridoxal phosphate-dependent aminotransferase [Bacteroidales bacterium]MBD5209092.1 pyridoxal phosphate-dependent aminotransferase [Bacteroidales bacterium]